MSIAVFISPHGFGHAARATAVMEEMNRRGEVRFEVFTTVPEVFFQDYLDGPLRLHPIECDIGLRQRSALEIDIQGSVKALEDLRAGMNKVVERVARSVVDLGCSLVLCDISPMGILVAEQAGIPSVLIENFTWDWIYEPFVAEAPAVRSHLGWLAEVYERAALRLQTQPVCQIKAGAVTTPPVARKPRRSRERVREELGIGLDDTVVLLTMGGLRQNLPFLDQVDDFQATFLVTGWEAEKRSGHALFFDRKQPPYLPDLIAASDLVVSKLGYSTMAEVWLQDRPFLYVANDQFRETAVLRRFVQSELDAEELSQDEFHSGEWLHKVARRKLRPTDSGSRCARRENGAPVIAERVLDVLEQ